MYNASPSKTRQACLYVQKTSFKSICACHITAYNIEVAMFGGVRMEIQLTIRVLKIYNREINFTSWFSIVISYYFDIESVSAS